jgi:hypothetical protein
MGADDLSPMLIHPAIGRTLVQPAIFIDLAGHRAIAHPRERLDSCALALVAVLVRSDLRAGGILVNLSPMSPPGRFWHRRTSRVDNG